MKKFFVLFILFILSINVGTIKAQPYVELNNLNRIILSEHNLWAKTTLLDRQPSFSELKKLDQTSNRITSIFGASGAYTAAIKLTNINAKNDTWFVVLHVNYLDVGTAYWQPDKGNIVRLENFGHLENKSPKLSHSQAFSLPLNNAEKGTLWIYIQAKIFPTPADIKFESKTEFYSNLFFTNTITTASSTAMMALALISFLIYLRTKYLVTLACSGYIGLHGLGWFAASGNLGHFFTVQAFNPVYIGILIFPFAIASAAQFTKLLFNCQKEHVKLAKTFNLLSIISVMLGIVMLFLPFSLSYLISHIIAIVWIPLCIGTGVFMLNHRDFRAKYYLAGNILYSLTLAIYVLSHSYQINLDISPELIVQIALTFDCICILLSLSEWLQIKQKEFYSSYATSRIDQLTQIGNRFAQNEMLSNLTGSYCLTFIDLDGFKNINDKFGHEEGDNVLIETAKMISKQLHGLGTIFRCGGDEFIVVVRIKKPQDVEPNLLQLTDIILKTEKELQHRKCVNVGLSFGIATSFETLNQSECLSLADERMYKYKQHKKHCDGELMALIPVDG